MDRLQNLQEIDDFFIDFTSGSFELKYIGMEACGNPRQYGYVEFSLLPLVNVKRLQKQLSSNSLGKRRNTHGNSIWTRTKMRGKLCLTRRCRITEKWWRRVVSLTRDFPNPEILGSFVRSISLVVKLWLLVLPSHQLSPHCVCTINGS